MTVVDGTSSVGAMLDRAAGEIRTSNCIAIIGAGASFQAGFPLGGQLPPLLWQALDAVPAARMAVAAEIGVADQPAQALIRDDWDRIKAACKNIAENAEARRTFQTAFCTLDRERMAASPAHDALARLIHEGLCDMVISFNWDTLLERTYESLYGIGVNAHGTRLHKPHGDVRVPDAPWTLLHEPGHLSDDLLERVQQFVATRPRVLLVVGYSESDALIVEKLVGPLAQRWRVIRVGPRATGDLAIAMSAPDAMSALCDRLCTDPEIPGWQHVAFSNKRDLGPAIWGKRLGPSDVSACPQLPHVRETLRRLQASHAVCITGQAGTGKSITAYQAAAHLQAEGWEVLRPTENLSSDGQLLQGIGRLRHPSVLIVDDAQLRTAELRRQLEDRANRELNIIVVATDPEPVATAIWVGREDAVASIADAYRARRDEVLQIVHALDHHVSDQYLDTSIEARIDEAARDAKSPWEFNFILRGGWRSAEEQLSRLRDCERADLLLLAIAARQVIGLDAPVPPSWPEEAGRLLRRNGDWANASLGRLRAAQAIVDYDGIRCPHIRFANLALETFLSRRGETERENALAMFRTLIADATAPVQGIVWLIHNLRRFGFQRGPESDALIPSSVRKNLIRRCLDADNAESRNHAANLLSALAARAGNLDDTVEANLDVLCTWIEQAEYPAVYGLANLINDVINGNRGLAQCLAARLSPQAIANGLSKATQRQAAGWGYFLGRIGSAAPKRWRKQFPSHIDRGRVLALVQSLDAAGAFDLSKLATGLCSFEEELPFACIDAFGDQLKVAFANDPMETWRDLHDLLWLVLGHVPDFLRHRKPDQRQREYSRRIAAQIPVERIAADLAKSRPRDWERCADFVEWLEEVDPVRYREFVSHIDLAALDERTRGLWAQPARALHRLINLLAAGKDCEPARTWVARHEHEIEQVDALVAAVAPKAAIAVAHRGGRVTLIGKDWHYPRLVAMALAAVARHDRELARRIAGEHCSAIAAFLSKLQADDCPGVPALLKVLAKLDATLPIEVLNLVDPDLAEPKWSVILSDRKRGPVGRVAAGRRTVRDLLQIAQRCDPAIRAMASRVAMIAGSEPA